MAVITITSEMATGARKLGRFLARRLDYQYVDKSLFQKIAEDLNVSERTLESFEKSRGYKISNAFAKVFSASYIERIVGYDKSVVEEEEYQKSLRNLILETARENNVVIIGRAAYFFLKDMKNCYHFSLVAPMDWKKKYASENYRKRQDRVQKFIEKRDRNLRWFRQSICGAGFDDFRFFHLTLNMSRISSEKGADLIMSVANLSS
ncbi:MAG: cytidylate kinase-like family protein [Desulfobacteraceae bacterium]|nr:cytidylate kinase-like family protein [Desulfobacteraceae bacterium]MDH3574411.1 cytidylate kinase-like family protein [Desulfobacteraceae bacterium]MDH3722430.1 cytidylate kinase-like family protein [Desulfobacteraceae bacterium]MDH3837640.1 cytidylate kinase-like family protein [Desulfobacteraceae bacterium]MDH3875844.1 cytidylate kinase-like family protein [Desulfobacteraceae bacterium]